MDNENPDVCGNCRFWVDLAGPEGFVGGDCRRLSPERDGNETKWPNVGSDDWCGEHVRKGDS